jgi:hypothetical protein
MGSPDTASPVATRSKGRKYGFACLSCRRKKIKCDGNKPACINCNKSKESCVYRDNPAFVGYLADELRKSKIRIQELESVIKELLILDPESRHLRLTGLVTELEQRSSSPSPGSSAFLESDEPHVGLSVSYGGSVEYNIDENGRVSKRLSKTLIKSLTMKSNNILVPHPDFILCPRIMSMRRI